MTRLLASVQWQQFVRGLFSARKVLVALLIGAFGLFFLALLTGAAVAVARSSPLDALGPLVAIGLLILGVVLLLADLPQVFNQLFSSRDLELLFTLPIPTRSVFLVKYGQMMVTSGLITLVAAVVPLAGYGIAAGVSWLYYPILLLTVASLTAGVVALCYLLSLLLVRVLPASRVREFMAVLTMLAGLLGGLSGQIIGYSAGTGTLDRLTSLPMPPVWLPMTWGGEAVVRAARGEIGALAWAGGLVALSIGLLVLSTLLVERGFRVGWVRLSEGGGRRRAARTAARPETALSSPVVAISLKEWRMLRRDIREWMSLLPLLVFFGIAVFRLLGGAAELLAEGSAAAWIVAQIMLLSVLAFASPNFSAPAIAREGLGVWVLRTAPLSGWQVALGKFWVYYALPAAMLLIMEIVVGLYLGVPLGWIVAGFLTVAVLIAGAVALGLWAGTIGAKYNPDRPNDRLQTGISFVLFGLTIVYLLLALVPASITLLPTELEPDLADATGTAGGVLGLLLRAALVVVRLKAAHPALATGLGAVWLILVGVGIALLTLWRSARRVDAGVQVQIVERR